MGGGGGGGGSYIFHSTATNTKISVKEFTDLA